MNHFLKGCETKKHGGQYMIAMAYTLCLIHPSKDCKIIEKFLEMLIIEHMKMVLKRHVTLI